MTASVQLTGHKRWRMMNPGPQVDTVFDRFETTDSGIYKVSRWDPEFEFIVPSGGGVVFPPYNIHETIGSTKECTTATTFNFFSPQPTRYFRRFLPRLLNTHLGFSEKCGQFWDPFATFISTFETRESGGVGRWHASTRFIGRATHTTPMPLHPCLSIPPHPISSRPILSHSMPPQPTQPYLTPPYPTSPNTNTNPHSLPPGIFAPLRPALIARSLSYSDTLLLRHSAVPLRPATRHSISGRPGQRTAKDGRTATPFCPYD